MKHAMREEIVSVIREVLAPMVVADGGEMYVVEATDTRVAVHLTGKFSGCPGNDVFVRQVFTPALAAIAPKVRVDVTWGHIVPDGAEAVPAVVAPERSA